MKKYLVIPLLGLLPMACAVPVPPRGGPVDSNPPSVVETTPSDGQTSFLGERLEFLFDEAVNLRSFNRAFSITPDLDGQVDIRGSGKRVTVKFPGPLRDSTTYIVTLDASLRDVRNVSLSAPITLAFSTGNEINEGKLSGRLVHAATGLAASAVDIFAFADHDSLTLASAPAYRTQSAANGSFSFTHLNQSAYFVVAVSDANRNRLMDPGEKMGVPPVEFVIADTLGEAPDNPWILSVLDRIPPEIDRVRAVTLTDIEIRFSEPLSLNLNHVADWAFERNHSLVLEDSVGNRSGAIHDLYFTKSSPRTLFARTDRLWAGTHILVGSASASDSLGNVMDAGRWEFSVSSSLPDRGASEFLGWVPDSLVAFPTVSRTVWLPELFGFRLDSPVDSLRFSAADTSGAEIFMSLDHLDPTLYRIGRDQQSTLEAPFLISIDISGRDSLVSGLFEFASPRQSGALVLETNLTDAPVVIELYAQDSDSAPILEISSSEASIIMDGLPGGFRARIRAYLDLNSDGRWNPGSVSPFETSEPVRWITAPEPVRARWETVLPDTLDFGISPGLGSDPAENE